MKKKIGILLALVCYTVFVLVKYTASLEQKHTNEASLTVVTSFYPMYIHTQALTQGVPINLVNMASPKVGCLHDYQLTVSDMRTLKQADLMVINGLGAESFIEKAISQNPHLQVIEASGPWELAHEDEGAHQEAEADAAAHHHHEGEDHDHGNQHLWMSIEGSISQVQTISLALQQADPTHAQLYQANEADYIQALEALDEEITNLREVLEGKPFVMVHETFAYMAEALGLETLGIIAADEKTSLTAKEVEALVAVLEAHPDAVIFTEPQYNEMGIVSTIAQESGASVHELDALVTEGITQDQKGYEYIRRMRENIQVLKEAYGV